MSLPKANSQIARIHAICCRMLLYAVQMLRHSYLSTGQMRLEQGLLTKVKARKVA